jgi:hypothetical protein
MPIAFVAIVPVRACSCTSGTRYTHRRRHSVRSADYAAGRGGGETSSTIDARDGIQAFVDWLNLTVPARRDVLRPGDGTRIHWTARTGTMFAAPGAGQDGGLERRGDVPRIPCFTMYVSVTGNALLHMAGRIHDLNARCPGGNRQDR